MEILSLKGIGALKFPHPRLWDRPGQGVSDTAEGQQKGDPGICSSLRPVWVQPPDRSNELRDFLSSHELAKAAIPLPQFQSPEGSENHKFVPEFSTNSFGCKTVCES